MDLKDVEKMQETTEDWDVPTFEKVWERIQLRIEKKEKKRIFWRKCGRPLATACACLVITCAVALPLALQKPNDAVYYLNDDLQTVTVDETGFHLALQSSDLQVVDLTRYQLNMCATFETETGVLKGGRADFLGVEGSSAYMVYLKFYNNDVKVSDKLYDNFDTQHNTKSRAKIEYKYDMDIQTYYVKGEYKTVQYFMEFLGDEETLTQFFETFFV